MPATLSHSRSLCSARASTSSDDDVATQAKSTKTAGESEAGDLQASFTVARMHLMLFGSPLVMERGGMGVWGAANTESMVGQPIVHTDDAPPNGLAYGGSNRFSRPGISYSDMRVLELCAT